MDQTSITKQQNEDVSDPSEHSVEMGSVPNKTSKSEQMVLEFGLSLLFLAATCTIVESQGCGSNCIRCDQYDCTQCRVGYGPVFSSGNLSCGNCSSNCSSCASIGAGYCDNCTDGYRLLPNNTCARTSVSTTTTNSGITPSTASIRTSIASFRTSTTTTLTTAVAGLSSTGIHVASNVTPCPILEVGLGIGIPCGFIIIVLLIIVICMCVQNKSLREYKRQNQDNKQNHSKDSSASNGTNQLPTTSYQHLDARNNLRQYDTIDRYNSISTTRTETTGQYEQPIN